MPADAPTLCPDPENRVMVEVTSSFDEGTNEIYNTVKETDECHLDIMPTPTQCTEDVLAADCDLHQRRETEACHTDDDNDSDEKEVRSGGGVSVHLEDTDLPLNQDSSADQVDLKYVDSEELGLRCKDESTREKLSVPSEENESHDGRLLDLSVYLKDPTRRRKSFTVSHVYMLHSAAMNVTASTSAPKESENGPPLTMYQTSDVMRLSTFNEFPPNIDVFVSRLVRSGFIYKPAMSELECCFCKLRLSPGEFVGVIPDQLHKRKSPDCPQMRGVELIQNELATDAVSGSVASVPVAASSPAVGRDCAVPFQPSVPTLQPSPTVHRDSLPPDRTGGQVPDNPPSNRSGPAVVSSMAGTMGSPSPSTSSTSSAASAGTASAPKAKAEPSKEKKKLTYSDLGIFAEKPKRPEMAVVRKREASFAGKWKAEYTQTPKMLADAGMYYAGYGDCARCFFCGGGLKNWEPPDSPWIEHARWFPKCGYIRMCKGQMFVDIVQRKNREKQEITLQEVEDEIKEKLGASRDIQPMDVGVPTSEVSAVVGAGHISQKDAIFGNSYVQQVADVEKLESENEELKAEIMCKICMDNESQVVFLPCGHLVSCTHCAHALQQCPLCRAEIKGSVRAHMG